MNLPYGSVAIIGTLSTSLSTSSRPSFSAACFLTAAHVPMPSCPSGELRYVWPAGRPPSSLPVETGRLAELSTYSRRKTWCAACEV